MYLAPPGSDVLIHSLEVEQKAIIRLVKFLNKYAWEKSSLFNTISIVGLWKERRPLFQQAKIEIKAGRADPRYISIIINKYYKRVRSSFWKPLRSLLDTMPYEISSFFKLFQDIINQVLEIHSKKNNEKDEIITFSIDADDQLAISLLNIELLKAYDKLKRKYKPSKGTPLYYLFEHIKALIHDFFLSQRVGIFIHKDKIYHYGYIMMGMGRDFIVLSLKNRNKSFLQQLKKHQKLLSRYSSRLGVYPPTVKTRVKGISDQILLTPHTYIPTPVSVFKTAFDYLKIERALVRKEIDDILMTPLPLFLDFGIGTGDAWKYAQFRIGTDKQLPIRVKGFDNSPDMVLAARNILSNTVKYSNVYEIDITDKDNEVSSGSLFFGYFHNRFTPLPIDISKCGAFLIDALNNPKDIRNFLDWLYNAYLPEGFKLFISVVMKSNMPLTNRRKKIKAIKEVLNDPKYRLKIEYSKSKAFPKRKQYRYFFGVRFVDAPEQHYQKDLWEILNATSDINKILRSYDITTVGDVCVMTRTEILKIFQSKMKPKAAKESVRILSQKLKKLSHTLHFAQKDEIKANNVKKALKDIFSYPEWFTDSRKDAVFRRIAIFLRYYKKSPSILNLSLKKWITKLHRFEMESDSLLEKAPSSLEIHRINQALVNAGLMQAPTSHKIKQYKRKRHITSST